MAQNVNNNNNSNNINKEDKIWFHDIEILIHRDKLDKYLPTRDMTYAQKSNSLVRLSIYVGIIFSILSKNYLYLYIPIGIMAFTYVMFLLRKVDDDNNNKIKNILNITDNSNLGDNSNLKNHLSLNQRNNNKSNFKDTYDESLNQRHYHHSLNGEGCVKPTIDNPFMNPSPIAPRNIAPPCSPLEEGNKKLIEKSFNNNLFKDANDIFNHRNGFRQFYTVPGNTFPNNRDTFMKWCYSRPKTCKEGNGNQCVANNNYDLRANSYYNH